MAHSVKHDAAFWNERLGTADGVAHWHFYAYEYLDDLAFMPRVTCWVRLSDTRKR